MNKTIFLISFFLYSIVASSQVGINTTDLDPSAALKVVSDKAGILIPRVTLNSTTDVSTILNPIESLLIFNSIVKNDIEVGYYYWSGTKWEKLSADSKINAQASFSNTNTTLDINYNRLAPIFDSVDKNDLPSLFVKNSSTNLTVTEAGRYEIKVSLYIYSNQNATQPTCQLKVNGSLSGALSASGYINTDYSNNETSLHLFETLNLDADDEIELQMGTNYPGSTATFKSSGSSSITITKIR